MGLEVLYLLIPASVILAVIALGLFVWATHTGQFDDLETPALRVLFDDGTSPPGTAPAGLAEMPSATQTPHATPMPSAAPMPRAALGRPTVRAPRSDTRED